jgi:hypothetical protein
VLQVTRKRATWAGSVVLFSAVLFVIYRISSDGDGYRKEDEAKVHLESILSTAKRYCNSLPEGKRVVNEAALIAARELKQEGLVDLWGRPIELMQVEGTCSFSARMQPPPTTDGKRQRLFEATQKK